jgi:hypothetical protein
LTTRCSNTGQRTNFYLRRNVHTESGDRPASCLMGTADSFPGVKRPGLEVNHLVSLVPRLRMSGAMPLVAVYSCTITCSFNALPQQLQPTLGIVSSPAVPLRCSTVSMRLQRAPEERVQIHEMRETRSFIHSFIHPPFLSWISLTATKNSIPIGCELWAISILGSHVYGLHTRVSRLSTKCVRAFKVCLQNVYARLRSVYKMCTRV